MKAILQILIIAVLSWQMPADLKIVIHNISPLKGKLYIALYNDEATFMNIDSACRRDIIMVEDTTASIIFKDLDAGDYAVAVFHDINDNAILDSRKAGIPKEPFGFSNDARGKLGPPKFGQAVFSFSDGMEININMVNNAK